MRSVELFVDGSRVGLCEISEADFDLVSVAADPEGVVMGLNPATMTISIYDQMDKGTKVKRYKDEKPRW